jgi:NAD+ kinase
MKRIVVFGGSLNPPGLHHREIAAALSERFDEVIVVPCGPRHDKLSVNDIASTHRAAMADLAFRGLPKVRVDLFDLEHDVFTRTIDLDERYRREGDVWHFVGADLVQHGARGMSQIQREWKDGRDLWQRLNFAVHLREGYALPEADLPPRHVKIDPARSGASNDIRTRCFRREPIDHLVTPEVGEYIRRHGLYHGAAPDRITRLGIDDPRPIVVFDEMNPKAERLAGRLAARAGRTEPNCIAVIGGDGTMLRAVREHWRLRLPFFGLNAGHLGHLMSAAPDEGELLPSEMDVYHQPLLHTETVGPDGARRTTLGFNDAWVIGPNTPLPGAVDQTPLIEVSVNGEVKIARLMADGVLVATPAGSTAYAWSAGAIPLRVDDSNLVLAAISPSWPRGWRPAHLRFDDVVRFRAVDPKKRPMIAKVDGVSQGWADEFTIRVSRIAAVELAFRPGHDIASKVNGLQFPKET